MILVASSKNGAWQSECPQAPAHWTIENDVNDILFSGQALVGTHSAKLASVVACPFIY